MAYIPFPRPVPIPGTDIDAVPGNSICFSQAWTPAVLGALKSLARPETWVGTEVEVNDAVREAMGLLALSSEYVPCSDSVNWTPFLGDDSCDDNSIDATLYSISLCETGALFRAFMGHAVQPPVGGSGIYRVGLTFKSLPGLSSVGGQICQLRMHQAGSTIGNVFSVVITTCLGGTIIENVPGVEYLKANFQAKQICMASLSPFTFSLSISGDWLCGPA